jgi:hypothetical protein
VIVLCANSTSWNERRDRLIPGGQGDRYLRPILDALPAGSAVIARQPEPGAVNAYMNHRGRYRADRWQGEHASVLLSHGIASKTYRDAAACARFTHVVAPGPALAAEIHRSGVPRSMIRQVGYPKLDPIHRGEVACPWPGRDGRIRVLWAPTHGGGSEVHRRGNRRAPGAQATTWWHRDELLGLLDCDRFLVVEAPHPRHHPQRQATLAEYVGADVVLGDGGSTMYEAWCVALPVVFADWITARRNLTRAQGSTLEARVYREAVGWHATGPGEFAAAVEAAAAAGITDREHQFSLEALPAEHRGHGGKLHAELLQELADGPPRKLHAVRPRRPEETTVKFVSVKYPELSVPTIGVRFRTTETAIGVVGVADVATRGAIAHLQSPWMRRRGVRPAEPEDLAPPRPKRPAETPTEAGPPVEATEPTPPPAGSADGVPDGTAGDVLAWVGDNPQRARQALDAEQQRDKPRKGVVARLTPIASAADVAEVSIAPVSIRHATSSEEI